MSAALCPAQRTGRRGWRVPRSISLCWRWKSASGTRGCHGFITWKIQTCECKYQHCFWGLDMTNTVDYDQGAYAQLLEEMVGEKQEVLAVLALKARAFRWMLNITFWVEIYWPWPFLFLPLWPDRCILVSKYASRGALVFACPPALCMFMNALSTGTWWGNTIRAQVLVLIPCTCLISVD